MDPRIWSVIERMEKEVAADLAVPTLAAGVGLSPSYFSWLFVREVGTSPGRYLRDLRMKRARVLLESTFLTVKQVMTLVGVKDPSHFTREFCKHHGLTPTAARQRVTADAPGTSTNPPRCT
jgi:transcriptional regulator GlxA family with amidase domain